MIAIRCARGRQEAPLRRGRLSRAKVGVVGSGMLLALAACSGQTPAPVSPSSPTELAQKPADVVDVDLSASPPPPPTAQVATADAADAGADDADEGAESEPAGVIGVIGDDSTLGELTGDSLGEANGVGGLGLRGIGLGAGGVGGGTGPSGVVGGLGLGPGFGVGPRAHATPGAPQASGKLPPEVIRRVVLQHGSTFRACYEGQLARNPTLEGKLVIHFVIGKDGSVMSVQRQSSTIQDQDVVSCVVAAFQRMAFPPPDGGVVDVKYPIVFRNDDAAGPAPASSPKSAAPTRVPGPPKPASPTKTP